MKLSKESFNKIIANKNITITSNRRSGFFMVNAGSNSITVSKDNTYENGKEGISYEASVRLDDQESCDIENGEELFVWIKEAYENRIQPSEEDVVSAFLPKDSSRVIRTKKEMLEMLSAIRTEEFQNVLKEIIVSIKKNW